MKEMFFHDIQEIFSFLEKEYGSNWYNKVLVDIFKDETKVEDGKGMMKVRILDIDELGGKSEIKDLNEILQESADSIKSDEELEKEIDESLKEYDKPRVEITVSDDKMKAYATIYPAIDGKIPTIDEILESLEKARITSGIKKESIIEALKEKCIFKPFLIAEGKPPIPPKDAHFNLLFPASGIKLRKENEKERIDYASMYEIAYCRKGDKLVEKIPGEDGKSGYDVFGNELPAEKPKDVDLRIMVGKNVELSEDGNSIVASKDGQPFFSEERKVNVKEVFVVNGNLDYSVGNIDFLGTVWVKGNVEESFKIKAAKDVIIDGVVGGAEIESEGSVVIKGGVFGKHKGMIVVKGDFRAKFLSEATVISKGDVKIDEYVMNSTVISGGNVIVNGKGWIVGGSVKASKDIMANVIGSVSKVPTLVAAGIDFEFSKEEEEIETKLQKRLEDLKKISMVVKQVLELFKGAPDEKEKGNLLRTLNVLQKRKMKLVSEIQALKNNLEKMALSRKWKRSGKDSRIVVRQKCFEGTRLTIFDETLSIHFDIGPTIFSFDKLENRLIATPYGKWN